MVYLVDNNVIFSRRSTDRGLSYSTPIDITATAKHPQWSHHPWSTFTGPGGGIQLTSGPKAGRLVVPAAMCTDPLSTTGLSCVEGPNSVNVALLSYGKSESHRKPP